MTRTRKANLYYIPQIEQHIKEVRELGSGADLHDPDDLKSRFIQYISLCIKNDQRPGNRQAYMAMGISKSTANAWRNGKRRKVDERYRELMEDVNVFCGAYRENLALSGYLSPELAIFQGKNYDGMADDVHQQAAPADPLGPLLPAEKIACKYKDIITEV